MQWPMQKTDLILNLDLGEFNKPRQRFAAPLISDIVCGSLSENELPHITDGVVRET
jgi:hypothetical protein